MNKTTFLAEVATLLGDNSTGAITEADLRALFAQLAEGVQWSDGASMPITPTIQPEILLAAAQPREVFLCDHPEETVLTIPSDADRAFSIGTVIHAVATGGGLRYQAAPGVTLAGAAFMTPMTRNGYSLSVIKTAADSWRLVGVSEHAPGSVVRYETMTTLTASSPLQPEWQHGWVETASANVITISVPDDATFSVPPGAEFTFASVLGVPVVFLAAIGVTLIHPPSRALRMSQAGAVVHLVKLAPDQWRAYGDLDLA